MIIYIDITQLNKGRANTGIQRVVKEFLQRAMIENKTIVYKVISYNYATNDFEQLDNSEIKLFLQDIENFQFKDKKYIDITKVMPKETTILFEIDSLWNAIPKRNALYSQLKKNGFLIFNFIYDLVPIVMPSVAHEETIQNFKPFLNAIYNHSDMVFFDSQSAKSDFIKYKDLLKNTRNISTRVVGLGSDFIQLKEEPIDTNIKDVLSQKYILFVGTIEPRKNQKEMLDAFEILAEKYDDLNLVFIGKQGWSVEALIHKIKTHKLLNKRLYWFNDISDNILHQFYKNAFLVTYFSKYEGYGLPIAESLKYANITIASKNSSMYEVGKDYVDYIVYNSKNEIVDTVSLYYDNKLLYESKKSYIKNNFKPITWDKMYNSIKTVFDNFEKSLTFLESHRNTLQFVFISIDLENLKNTIKEIDNHVDFVKEYIIVTQSKLVEKFKQINTNKKLTIIDEVTILKEYAKDFHKRDHQSKNWLLRASLLNLDILDEEFIMLDDDNRPLKDIKIDKFIDKQGKYNAYYFYNLLDWHHKETDYDLGQQNMKEVLSSENYDLLSYSSHAPQIINKSLLKEAVEKFFDLGLVSPLDEWSVYFNYAVSNYPYLFNNKPYETLNWPSSPSDWEIMYEPKEYSFENYYQELYVNGTFNQTDTYEDKIRKKQETIAPYLKSQELFKNNLDTLQSSNMVHGIIAFKKDDVEIFFSSIPYYIFMEENAILRLKLNYKLLNKKTEKLDISLSINLNGSLRYIEHLKIINDVIYQESIVEIPINSHSLEQGIYDITFNISINKNEIFIEKSPYLMKLIVTKEENQTQYFTKKVSHTKSMINKSSLINKTKSIPYLGWFLRWCYNLSRLNNIKHILFMQQKHTEQLKSMIQTQSNQMIVLNEMIVTQSNQTKENVLSINRLQQDNQKLKQDNQKQISKEFAQKTKLFHGKIESFIDETKEILQNDIDFKNKIEKVEENFNDICMDDYYLSFEDVFRGSRELIIKRYEEYLPHINKDVKKALDIGCGRGEWTGLLQSKSIDAYGIDLNLAMLTEGISQGTKNLKKADVFEYFKTCEDNTFDLVTAFHIIEHIPHEKLLILIKEIKRVAKPNAIVMLETPNPENLLVAAYTFYRDPTHLNPLPAEVIKFMLSYFGFEDIKVEYLHPVDKSQYIQEDTQAAARLNHYLHQAQDYLIIAHNSKKI